uniref:Uncharacterized protein n=1 Tax=Acrobeloides nanus TaxID=290746 RepID=A0A914CMQ5_9BILA
MEEAYGFEFKPLSEDDREKFERYVQLANAKLSDGIDFRNTSSINNVFKLTPMFEFKEAKFENGSSFHIEIPEVSAESLKIYQEVASRSQFEPLGESLKAYEEYR